ncbi:InlB B-repeat-containing protein [Pelagicoccus mobilis]|uniref:InlB B-repeat-containing protein n=1 Tax=Pelagicoccus mobilis TaxID=415221 RepID=UPI00366F4999
MDGDQVNEALDIPDESGLVWWEFYNNSSADLEVVDDEDAEGGKALKVLVPANQEVLFMAHRLEDPSQVHFRYKLEAAAGLEFNVEAYMGGWSELVDLPTDVLGEWRSAVAPNEYLEEWGWKLKAGSEECVVYLDALSTEEGFRIVKSGWGAEVTVEPVRELYQVGEYVTVAAVPDDDGLEFLYWDGWFQDLGAEWSGVFTEGGEPIPFLEAVAGRRFDFGEVQAYLPVKTLLGTEISTDGALQGVSVAFVEPHASGKIFWDIEGPGRLRFEYGGELKSVYFGPGHYRHSIEISEEGDLREVSFEKGYRIQVNTMGMGAVAGDFASGGVAGIGDLLELRAIPEDGWEFLGWKGIVESSEEEIEFVVRSAGELVAEFGKVVESPVLEAFQVGSPDWVVSGSGDDAVIAAKGSVGSEEKSALAWRVKGPGVFSFDAKSMADSLRVYVNGKDLKHIENSDAPKSYAFELDGSARLIEIWNDYAREIDIELSNLSWEPGWELNVREPSGGRIDGYAVGTHRVQQGEKVSLTAVPEDGYEFLRWEGDVSGNSRELSFTMYREMEVKAVFSKDFSGHSLVSRQGGVGDWTIEEGIVKSPASLEPGEKSYLFGSVVGPARIRVIEPAPTNGRATFRVINSDIDLARSLPLSGGANAYIPIPEGTHEFQISIERAIDDYYYPMQFELLADYQVRLSALNGSVSTEPELVADEPWNSNSFPYVPHGTELSVTAVGIEGTVFDKWTGTLSGAGASESIVVESAVVSEAAFLPSQLEVGGILWTIDKPESVYVGPNFTDAIGFNNANPEVELSAEVVGPGILSISKQHLLGLEYRLGDSGPFEVWPGHIDILEGAHTVTLRAQVPEYAIVELDRHWPWSGLYPVRYYSGYPVVQLNSSPYGGDVNLEPSGFIHEAGTEVAVSVLVDEGNVFKGWRPPHDAKGSAFNITVDGPYEFDPIFEAEREQGGLTWLYEGPVPTAGKWGSNPFEGVFFWNTDTFAEGEVARATTSVVGPGVLWLDVDPVYGDIVLASDFFVDGAKVELVETLGPRDKAMGVVLEEGVHQVALEVTPDESSGSSIKRVYVPNFQTEFSVQASSYSATITGGNGTGLYGFGEIAEFEAPETDDNGRSFYRWRTRDYPAVIVSEDRMLRLEVEREVSLIAEYTDEVIERFDVGTLIGVGEGVSQVNLKAGPDGGRVYEIADQSWLQLTVSEDTVVTFNALFEEGSPGTLSYGVGYGDRVLLEDELGWVRCSLFVEGGRTLTLKSSRNSVGGYISDVNVAPGWGPSYAVPLAHEMSSEQQGDGGVELEIDLQSEPLFSMWTIDGELVSGDATLAVAQGFNKVVRPTFRRVLESELGRIILNHERAWNQSSDLGIDEVDEVLGTIVHHFRWSARRVEGGPLESALTLEVEGPKFMVFGRGVREEIFSVFVDGEPALIVDRPLENWKVGVQIPEGASEVTLHVDWSGENKYGGWIDGFEFFDDVFVAETSSEFGRSIPQRGVGWYDLGEVTEFIPIPNVGYVFSGWLPPYENESIELSIRAGIDPEPIAVFSGDGISEYEVDGRVWRGADIEYTKGAIEDGDEASYRHTFEYVGSGTGSISTGIEGPAVLWLDEEALENFSKFRLDGKTLLESLTIVKASSGDGVLVGIPSGKHVFEIALNNYYKRFVFDGSLEVIPGYLLEAKGVGGEVAVTPDRSIFALGETVRVEGVIEEWLGVPEGATMLDDGYSLEVDDHLSIRGLVWEEQTLFGFPFQKASNGAWMWKGTYYESPLFNQSGDVYLKLSGLENGLFEYQFDFWRNSIPETLAPRVLLNGNSIPYVLDWWGNGRYLEGALPISGESDEVIFEIVDNRIWSQYDLQVYLRSLVHKSEEVPGYLEDWIRRVGFVPNKYSVFDTVRDYDLDGIPNFVEYDLGFDPQIVTSPLSIGPRSDGGLYVSLAGLTEEQKSKYVLRAMQGGVDVDPDTVLEPIVVFENSEYRKVRESVARDGSLMFYYEYLGEIPDFEALLEEIAE